jgi:RNA polymerase sigma-70 factor (ECF subfamily)
MRSSLAEISTEAGITMDVPPTDQELARKARAGSLSCFEELVRRYQVPLLRFLLRKISKRHDAEDVLQEAFLKAYQSLDLYREAWPFKTWIFTLTYRLAISAARKARPVMSAEDIDEVRGNDESPLRRIQRDESRDRLWRTAREILGEEQFSAVWLHYGESMPAGDVAQVMGRSWVWVKTNLHRARKKLLPHVSMRDEVHDER